MIDHEYNQSLEVWKMKRLIKMLESARGNGTSMISLILPPKSQLPQTQAMLQTEYGTASNIKSRVNRQSVLTAITSVQQKLKLYNRVPDKGLVVYTGTILTEDGKEKRVSIDFEPFKPINTSLYLCDNKFHTEALSELMKSDQKYGFIVMDGGGALFATLSGNTREVLHRFSVELPKKHGRGGQSALRFARLRLEKRHNYVRKVAELAAQNFITNERTNVVGMVLAGSADFKTELLQSDMFDQRLQAIVVAIVDVSYGGDNGFNQAIELSSEALSSVKFIQEQKLICRLFDEIAKDTNRYVFGLADTLQALEIGAVETLIVWEDLEIMRYELINKDTGEITVKYLSTHHAKNSTDFKNSSGQDLDIQEQITLLDWLANNFRKTGFVLELVTDKSQEGSQFVRGFGGIGGLLRYQINVGEFDGLQSNFGQEGNESYWGSDDDT
jgi:peptide chain release factor subunit 1